MSTGAAIFLGIAIGLIAGVSLTLLLVRGNISNTMIKGKVKQKKTQGSIQDVSNSITAPGSKKDERKEKKEERKAERQEKRDLRKTNK